MPRETKKEELAAAQDPRAPFLFDESNLPVRNDLVAAVAAGRYRHTGARLLDNDAKALRMVELLMAGWGLKRIAKEMGVAKASIRAARAVLVERGEMAPYKQRVVAMFEDIIEEGARVYLDGLERGLVAPAQIPVGLGIISDKRALALGEPTSIGVSGQVGLDKSALSVEALNAWVKSLPVDGQSTVKASNPPDVHQLKPAVAQLVAQPAGNSDPPTLDPTQADPTQPDQAADQAMGGGGGSDLGTAADGPTQCPGPNLA